MQPRTSCSGLEQEADIRESPLQDKTNASTSQSDRHREKPEGKVEQEETPKVTSKTCKPIAAKRPKIELPNHRINGKIQFMKDHVLIGKFIGF